MAAGPDAGLVRWRTSSRVVEGRLQRQLLYTATSRGASAPAGACKATKRGGRVTVSSPGRCHGRVNVSFPCHGSGPFSLIAEAQMPDSFARAAPAVGSGGQWAAPAPAHGEHAGYDSGLPRMDFSFAPQAFGFTEAAVTACCLECGVWCNADSTCGKGLCVPCCTDTGCCRKWGERRLAGRCMKCGGADKDMCTNGLRPLCCREVGCCGS